MASITVHWPNIPNEHGDRMLWHGSWLVGNEGGEGPQFYSGRGGDVDTYQAPSQATGVRLRRWPNEGLDFEYADILDLSASPSISADELEYDKRQHFARIPGVDEV